MENKIVLIDSLLDSLIYTSESEIRKLQRSITELDKKLIELKEMKESISKEVLEETEKITTKLLTTLERIDKEEDVEYKMPQNYTGDFYQTSHTIRLRNLE